MGPMSPQELKSMLATLISATPKVPGNSDLLSKLNVLYNQKNIVQRPFFHTMMTVSAGIAGAAIANLSTPIPDDFLIQATTYQADIAAAIQTDSSRVIALCTLLLSNQGTGYYFSDAAVPISSMFGIGREPYVWPQPQYLPAQSILAGQLTNLTAATTYNVRLVFHGVKLFAQ